MRWLSAEESPFGVEVLDCRPVACSMISVTEDKSVSESYVRQRAEDGRGLAGRSPGPVHCACDLSYPHRGETRDGPLFKAGEMEDKWDIYLYESHLYFTRSWTGSFEIRARMVFEAERARMVEVETTESSNSSGDFLVATADFLIRRHLYRWIVPHPLPPGLPPYPQALAMLSFNLFGRRGWFGTFAATPSLEPQVMPD